jgi:tRNA-2-methylthio-N6-dimethylallyladenosine synthase
MNKKVYIETYGCQMNMSDTEIVSSLLIDNGFDIIDKAASADVILLNTCSVRDNAERKIFEKLTHLKQYKKKNSKLVVGILGCMAERLQDKLTNEHDIVNIAIGPDEYRKIPELIQNAFYGQKGIAVELGTIETYDDIIPLRTEGNCAWLSIMRGCNNFCSFCVVPATRGRERSRPMSSILKEVEQLQKDGFKEVTLLGQNVNSYRCPETKSRFPELLSNVAKTAPKIRFRFTSSHPKDISDRLIEVIAENPNVCNHIHLAMQSGSNRILKLMKRRYTFEHYLSRIEFIKKLIPDCSLTTDIIAGFPSETIEDHQDTLRAMETVEYDGAYMFKYSARENTTAYDMEDDVPDEEKTRRLNEIIDLQHKISRKLNKNEINRIHEVLVEGPSKKNKEEWFGRTDTNKVVVFPAPEGIKQGDKFKIKISRYTSATLFGEIVEE